MNTLCQQPAGDAAFPITMGVNAFRGFLDEFIRDKPKRQQQKTTKSRKRNRRNKKDKKVIYYLFGIFSVYRFFLFTQRYIYLLVSNNMENECEDGNNKQN